MLSNGDDSGAGKAAGEVVVLGVGNGGLRILRELAGQKIAGKLSLVGLDCDEEALRTLDGETTVLLGRGLNCAKGCGGEVTLGERAAAAAAADIRQTLAGARLAIVCAGLGGGTGTGAVVGIARHARDLGVPSFFLVTLPFSFEGSWRVAQADAALPPLREQTDAVIAVPNDAIFSQYAADLSATEAFALADKLVAECIGGLAAAMWGDRLLSADFGVIRAALGNHRGTCRLASGRGNGPDRIRQAVDSFLDCPLIGNREALLESTVAVVNLQAAYDISLAEVNSCMSSLQKVFPTSTRLSVGVCKVDDGEAEIQLTGILCQAKTIDACAPANDSPKAGGYAAMAGKPSIRDRAPVGNRNGPIQDELPFQEYALGMFAEASPTRYEGENLDIPTFQRHGIKLDLG